MDCKASSAPFFYRLGLSITAIGILPGRWLAFYGYHEHGPSPVDDAQITFWVAAACVLTGLFALIVGQISAKEMRPELAIPFTVLAYLAWLSVLAGSFRYA